MSDNRVQTLFFPQFPKAQPQIGAVKRHPCQNVISLRNKLAKQQSTAQKPQQAPNKSQMNFGEQIVSVQKTNIEAFDQFKLQQMMKVPLFSHRSNQSQNRSFQSQGGDNSPCMQVHVIKPKLKQQPRQSQSQRCLLKCSSSKPRGSQSQLRRKASEVHKPISVASTGSPGQQFKRLRVQTAKTKKEGPSALKVFLDVKKAAHNSAVSVRSSAHQRRPVSRTPSKINMNAFLETGPKLIQKPTPSVQVTQHQRPCSGLPPQPSSSSRQLQTKRPPQLIPQLPICSSTFHNTVQTELITTVTPRQQIQGGETTDHTPLHCPDHQLQSDELFDLQQPHTARELPTRLPIMCPAHSISNTSRHESKQLQKLRLVFNKRQQLSSGKKKFDKIFMSQSLKHINTHAEVCDEQSDSSLTPARGADDETRTETTMQSPKRRMSGRYSRNLQNRRQVTIKVPNLSAY